MAEEFFYYAQLRSQGEHATRSRRLDGTVPLAELPNLLCALGEAPTQLDLRNCFTECQGLRDVVRRQTTNSVYTEDQVPESRGIGFERFIELYVNHRTPQWFSYSDVIDAFKILSKSTDQGEISPEQLTRLLLTVS